MLNYTTFSKGLLMLKTNFEFDNNEIYLELVYDNIKEKCGPKRFMACINDLLLNKQH